MRKLNKILRFRFDDETVNALSSLDRKSEYVRTAGGMACKPCTTVSSSRNSFWIISYTACYVLGGFISTKLKLKMK